MLSNIHNVSLLDGVICRSCYEDSSSTLSLQHPYVIVQTVQALQILEKENSQQLKLQESSQP